MNIAYIADAKCCHGQKWINHFAEDNNVILITTANAFPAAGLSEKIKVFPVLPVAYPLRAFRKRKKTIRQIKEILSSHDTEVIHAMYAVPFAFWAYHIKHPKTIITTRGSDILVDYQKYSHPESFYEKIIFPRLKKLVEKSLEQAAFVTSTSTRQLNAIRELVSDKQKLILTRTGANSDLFSSRERGGSNNEVLILSNRALTPLYNIDLIIEAFKKAKLLMPEVNLKLGILSFNYSDEYFNKLKVQVADSGIEKGIRFYPSMNEEELNTLYQISAMVIMVPSSDGTPVSGIEVMMAERPLILGPLKYDQDLFNQQTIWQAESFSPDAICTQIINILKGERSATLKKTSQAYEAAIKHADLKTQLAKVRSLYQRLIGNVHASDEVTCTHCVLSTKDDRYITFDENGVCNHCLDFLERSKKVMSGEPLKFSDVIAEIKKAGAGKKFDSIIGVSGGIDSTYLALKAKEAGLRPLLVHYDNGWNSEIAVRNIEKLVTKINAPLITIVNDWEEFKDLQRSFFKASVIDVELLTDQAIQAALLNVARKNGVKYILSGDNFSTEGILPSSWYHWKADVANIKGIQKKFGSRKLKTYPTAGFWTRILSERFHKIKTVSLLNYLDYNRENAKQEIIEKLDWVDYGGKHFESVFTRFFQAFYLPEKFGIDKRKAHLATLICSGQITRTKAMEELSKPLYSSPQKLDEDMTYVCKKLGWTKEEFLNIVAKPAKNHLDYPSYFHTHYHYLNKLSALKKKMLKFIK